MTENSITENKLLTVREVADILRLIEPVSVYKFIDSGRLKATRLGKRYRIKQSDLDNFINTPSTEVSTRSKVKKNKRCVK